MAADIHVILTDENYDKERSFGIRNCMTRETIFDASENRLTVGDLFSGQVLCCYMGTPISDVVRMMWESGCSSIAVIFEGIWTETEALELEKFDRLSEAPVSSVMISPVKHGNQINFTLGQHISQFGQTRDYDVCFTSP